jgi:hypothetical protein
VNSKEDERMHDGDRSFFLKFAIDPEMNDDLDGYDLTKFDFGQDIDPHLENIEIDCIDEDSWGEY